jgi:hypothetical protein
MQEKEPKGPGSFYAADESPHMFQGRPWNNES